MAGLSERAAALVTSEPLMAHLATSVDDRPHVAPVWFDYADDRGVIEVLTTGRKLENIRENPRVALSIQKDENGQAQWKVTILGTATVVTDDDPRKDATRRINRKYGAEESAWPENELVRVSVGTVTVSEY
ncbi:pyridoxamine 5'-phosphate oxidase [Haloferax sp. Atlit-10N]|uniref:Pyridoxamine 5-phosphate oxidase family protein n=1 Tax=Haloferax prahovense (strain DSM 18310 / JCM 13924 / TL6) TaxID=1227461 RepID=M0FVV7_HALPT|nr:MULTISPECIES: pyridoxamine 5'-phosphate oxidase family protein [Haloferax]ELZ63392.1 Pyridoxamine 5-phosphate oxidase family protein [Haloferax prahovense DSM 18310]RDZ39753.1 pyridoxamine 5'-phosphate oxidase [Haloferax sp. Atlit-19N]RDZ39824.1 pyridoxamine 5'-phosphate oxidase [Haloferax sp. Atlit-16N]RDZ56649.1 pyridoxamine 5'-phosphate oxidase [Haloferax sp. Atlit-10N]